MPDTPGKRQRDTMKLKRRQAKEEKRAAQKIARKDPLPAPGDERADDQPIDPEAGEAGEADEADEADEAGEPRV